jgi:hypothetical protein
MSPSLFIGSVDVTGELEPWSARKCCNVCSTGGVWNRVALFVFTVFLHLVLLVIYMVM